MKRNIKKRAGSLLSFATLNCDLIFDGMPSVPKEGEEVFSQDFSVQLGGGSAASLIVASRLGIPAKLYTYIGSGNMFSDFIRKELSSQGITYEDMYQGNGVPFCISAVMNTVRDRSFASYLKEPSASEEDYARVLTAARSASIMTMGTDHPDLFRKIREENPDLILVLDFGWHEDLSIENYKALIDLADYYTPNEKEALKITGTSTPEEAIQVLSEYFTYPVVKLGSQGCLYMENGIIHHIPVLEGITARDTTGAGDAFLGGLLYGLYHQKSIGDCVRCGCITGGICASQTGCLKGYIDEQNLLGLL